jgi:ribonuclease HI
MNQSIAKIDRIYTDGACSGNPGPGGWGTVVYFEGGGIQELGDRSPATTNNRMEMQAAIGGLEYYIASGQKEGILLYTDSEYVKNGITKWISGWKKKGWKTAAGKDVLNKDLWEKLDELHSSKVEWRYVKGHSGDEGNERCDVIARSFSHNSPIPLRQFSAADMRATAKSEIKPEIELEIESEIKPEIKSEIKPEIKPEAKPINGVGLPLFALDELDSSKDLGESVLSKVIEKVVIEKISEIEEDSEMKNLRETIERLRIADEVAKGNYLLTTQELATIVQLTAKTIGAKKEDWIWRSWLISRVREESNQILWQLERIDGEG